MTLRDFDTELDRAGVTRLVVRHEPAEVVTEVPTVVERVTIRPLPTAHGAAHLTKADEEWDWEALRDYVVRAIEQRHGPFPRNFKTEHSIFKSFVSRWGKQAPAIARYAFEVCDGMWSNAPISINRFCKGSDQYFAAVINSRL